MRIHAVADWFQSLKISKAVYIAPTFAVLFVGITAVASSTEVTACVNNKTGSVKIINFLGGDCAKGETKIVWNTEGVKGDAGEKGDKGDTGNTGPAGAQLHLYDAGGQDLGLLISEGGGGEGFHTFDPNSQTFFQFHSDTQHETFDLVYGGNLAVLFASSDCTGTPYSSGHQAEFPYGYKKSVSSFYKSKNIEVGLLSNSRYDGDPSGNCVVGVLYESDAVEIEDPAPFTLPLSWPPRVE